MAESERSATLFTNSLYDKLKFVALILLPAFGALYFGLGNLWGFPHVEEIIGTVTVIDTFFGAVIKYSSRQYYRSEKNFDGEVIVTPEDGGNHVRMAFNYDPADMVNDKGRKTMEFKVSKHRAPE